MSRHTFTPADHQLWDDIRQSVRPLRDRPAKPPLRYAQPVKRSEQQHNPVLHRVLATPPALAAFDRRTAQKLARGQADPEARLDLHGDTVAVARQRLLNFLIQRHSNGDRLVLVITGKGASPYAGQLLHGLYPIDSPEREGKLRRELQHWLHEDIFRHYVIGYQPAHPRHGGGGAFYVRLRRAARGTP
jgi:DNA-nicking Smr family endonuclease